MLISSIVIGTGATMFTGMATKLVIDIFRKEEVIELTEEEKRLFEERLTKFFRNTELINEDEEVPILLNFTMKNSGLELKLQLQDGITKTDLEKEKENFEVYFKANSVKFAYDEGKNVDIIISKEKLKSKYDFEFIKLDNPCSIMFGFSTQSKPVVANIEKHLLVAGSSGMGKTTFLQTMLLNSVMNFKKDTLLLEIFDMKMVDLAFFKNIENTVSFNSTIPESLKSLQRLEKEMNERYELMSKAGVSNISAYNQVSKEKLPYKYIIFDELAAFNTKEGKACFNIINQLTSRSRACGYYCVVSTQRPDSSNLPSDIKANLSNILGLTTNNKFSSEVICGKSVLENLTENGHAVLFNTKETELRCIFIDTKDLKKQLKKLNNA